MNVMIVTGIFPPDIGGPATYVPRIAGELVNRGHRVAVLTLSDTDHDDGQVYAFHVLRIRRGLFKPWRVLLTIGSLLRNARDADVLFVNGLYTEAAVANAFLRKPLVQKLVGDWVWERAVNKGWIADSFAEFQRHKYGLRIKALKILRNYCARRAQAVIVPSRYLTNSVADWGVPKAQISVIYNALDPVAIAPATLPLATRMKVVTVGRLIALKQIDRLIEAIAECVDTGLVVVGSGPERRRLEELACRRGLLERVYFTGQKNHAETLSLMAGCDLFVLNSTHEGFPHVVLEAMTVGLPIVATAVGGTPELVCDGENGCLISPEGNGALAKIIQWLSSSPKERERLAREARRTVEKFRPTAMVDQTEMLLQRCATNRAMGLRAK